MLDTNLAIATAATLLRTLQAFGLEDLIASPGSRNTPLLYAADALGIRVWSVIDERSAGFVALGAARTTGRPMAVACTSGSAAAHYLPAVVEASQSRIPLVVITADRPDELRHTGAAQTIDQVDMYGSFVRWSATTGTPRATDSWMHHLAGTAARAMRAAVDGPVHLNVPFAEPLGLTGDATVPVPERLPEPVAEPAVTVDPDTFWPTLGARPLVIAGDGAGGAELTRLGASVPVFADPLVIDRRPPLLLRGNLLTRLGRLDAQPPTGVLRIGGVPTSKALMAWLETHREIPQVLIDPTGRRDPSASVRAHLAVAPETALRGADATGIDPAWVAAWREAEAEVEAALADLPFPSEPGLVAHLTRQLGGRDLWVGSSMPIRDIDDFGAPIEGRIHGTRGANGIDGLISAAAGAAAIGGRPVVVLVGDVSYLHDIGGLLTVKRLGADVTIFVVNNRGGGIFSFLPQADQPGPFDLIATPHDHDLGTITWGMGIKHVVIESPDDVAATLLRHDGIRVAEVRTDRAANRALHEALLARLAGSDDPLPSALPEVTEDRPELPGGLVQLGEGIRFGHDAAAREEA